MAKIPQKISDRISAGIKRFQPILASARSRDVGEADTVTIILEMLADIFGYDKFSEVTSEHAIRGTYCDLATKIDGVLQLLIEVKAIGLDLKEPHVKQAVDYAANQGVEWVVLTNGIAWRVYRVTFAKPINHELVIEFDVSAMTPKNAKDIESLFLICKEGWVKSVLGEYHTLKQTLCRFLLGSLLQTEPVLKLLRKELQRFSPDVRVDVDEIKAVLVSDVLKREVTEGEPAKEAAKKIAKIAGKLLRAKAITADKAESDVSTGDAEAPVSESDTRAPHAEK